MDLMTLVAKLTVDASEYIKGLKDAKREANGTGAGSVALGNLISQGFNTAVSAVKNFSGYVMESGKTFEATMSQVEAISGASGKDLEDLTNKAQEMGAKTKFSATESAEAFTYMAMAGWKTGAMLDGIEGIMNLAAASGENLATTSDIVTDALTAFGLKAEDAGHFSDILAAASSNANTNVSMMGETFKYVAPVAGSMGYSAEDTAVAIGLLANAGVKGSQAGTTLRAVMNNLSSPTDEVQEAMKTLGIRLEDDEGDMLSFREVMEQLRGSFGEGHLSAEEYADRLKIIQDDLESGKLQMSQYAQLQSALAEDFKDGKITAAEYEKGLKDLDTRVAMGSISTTGSYEEALKNLTIAMYGADGAQKAELASSIAGKNAMSGLLAILGATEEDWNKLTNAVDTSSDVIVKTVDGAFIPLKQALAEGIEYTNEYAGASEAMAAIMQNNLAGSMTILQSGVEALALAFYNGIAGTAKTAVDGLTTAVANITAKVTEWVQSDATQEKLANISEKVGQLIDKLGNNLDPILDGIIGLFGGLIDVATFVIDNFETIATTIEIVVGAFLAMKAAMAVLNIAGFITSPVGLAVAGITGLIAILEASGVTMEDVKGIFANAWNTIKGVWDAAKPYFQTILTVIKGLFAAAAPVIADGFKNAWTIIKSCWNVATSFFKTVWAGIKAVFAVVQSVLSGDFSGAWDAIKNVWDQATGFFQNIWEMIKSTFSVVSSVLSGFFSAAWNSIKLIWSVVTGVFEGYEKGIEKAFSGIASFFSKTFGDAWENVKKAWSGVGSFFEGVRSTISGVFSNLASSASSWGSDLINGFKRGVEKAKSGLTSVVSGVASSIRSFLHFSRPDVGPLRDYEKWMPDFVKGMAKGLEENTWRLENASAGIAGAMSGKINQGQSMMNQGNNTYTISINIDGSKYTDEQSLAEKISYELENLMSRRKAVFA